MSDIQDQILEELQQKGYFAIADNGAKTQIRDQLAEKYGVAPVWIKDVVVNGYGKRGRRIPNEKIAELLDKSPQDVLIQKESEDPAEGYVRFPGSRDVLYFVSSAPSQVGTGLMKAMSKMKRSSSKAVVIINNGNDGPIDDNAFRELVEPLTKLGIYAAGVHSGGISHKVEFLDLSEPSSCEEVIIDTNISRSLLSKPFLILTGPSGTGKTRGAIQIAASICAPDCMAVVAVGADWTDNRHVVGYLNPLLTEDGTHTGTPIYEDTTILKLLLHANEHTSLPHVLILDEMNLSHVERYFADFLSAMELDDKEKALKLHSAGYAKTREGLEVRGSIDFPENVYVIGTVNIDETTYMFSPKVLDRANVIEVHADPKELMSFLEGERNESGVEARDLGISFLDAARAIRIDEEHEKVPLLPPEVRKFAAERLMEIFNIMHHGRSEFGFRTGREVLAYLRTAYFLTQEADRVAWGAEEGAWLKALDTQILQKILPKLHGSRTRLSPLLGALAQYCATGEEDYALEHFPKDGNAPKRGLSDARNIQGAKFPKSYEKLERMIEVLVEEQFVSFIC